MNFGSEIRTGLTNLAAGLTNFGHSLENIHNRHHDWNEESTALGLISTEDQIRMLKRDLYCEVRLSNPNQEKIMNLTSAIGTFEELIHAEHIRKKESLKLQLSLPAQLNCFLNTTLIVALLTVIGSYVATYTCGNSHSMFCAHARSVVYPINKFFQD